MATELDPVRVFAKRFPGRVAGGEVVIAEHVSEAGHILADDGFRKEDDLHAKLAKDGDFTAILKHLDLAFEGGGVVGLVGAKFKNARLTLGVTGRDFDLGCFRERAEQGAVDALVAEAGERVKYVNLLGVFGIGVHFRADFFHRGERRIGNERDREGSAGGDGAAEESDRAGSVLLQGGKSGVSQEIRHALPLIIWGVALMDDAEFVDAWFLCRLVLALA